jgi:hypothetical protein
LAEVAYGDINGYYLPDSSASVTIHTTSPVSTKFHVNDSIVLAGVNKVFTIKSIAGGYYNTLDEDGAWQDMPITSVDAQYTLLDPSSQNMILLAEGSGSDLQDYLRTNVGCLPLGSKFSMHVQFNVAILLANVQYLSVEDFAMHELVPLFNQSGLTVHTPLDTTYDSVTITGTVTGAWTAPQGASQYVLSASAPEWLFPVILIMALVGTVIVSVVHWECYANIVANQAAADQVKYKSQATQAAIDAGWSPADVQSLNKALNPVLPNPPLDWMKYLPWIVGLGGAAIVIYGLTKK